MKEDWHPLSWRDFPLSQSPNYPDLKLLEKISLVLSQREGLVSSRAICALRDELQMVSQERGFLLQAGDCAEIFSRTDRSTTTDVVNLLHQMRDIIEDFSKNRVVVTGRIAGLFSKPRSQLWEKIKGQMVFNFHGEMINGLSLLERIPDPQRMLQAYEVIQRMMENLKSCSTPEFQFEKDFFTAHESYLLPFESALTRQDPQGMLKAAAQGGQWFGTSGHFLWVGERTRQLGGAHIHFIQELYNPIGIKVGPMVTPQELRALVDHVNPDHRLGKLFLIGRFGRREIETVFPPLIEAVKNKGISWVCDPMHGNTFRVGGLKTRAFEDIESELRSAFRLLQDQGERLKGMHCETFPADMTECLDLERNISKNDLKKRYTTACDPRLNREQALALARICGACLKESSGLL